MTELLKNKAAVYRCTLPPACNFTKKKRVKDKCFFVNFAKLLTSFLYKNLDLVNLP